VPIEDLAEDFCSNSAIEALKRPPFEDEERNCGARVTSRTAIYH